MSFFSNIRISLANLIGGEQIAKRNHLSEQVLSQLVQPSGRKVAEIMDKQYVPSEDKQLVAGKFYVMDLTRLSSERVRNAIASLGCWSAIARAFSEYERTVGHKHMSDAKLTALIDEFHAWNASSSARGYMGTDELFEAVAKMSVVNAPKGSKETDAILARVKKNTVEQIRAERLIKAEIKTKARIEMIDGFIALIEGYQGNDSDAHHMSSAKALDKALHTLDWVAGWDSNNPAEQAAELLMIEDDIRLIRELSKSEKQNTEDYVDGVMASDTLERNINGLDSNRRAGESAKGYKGYEPEPMEEVLEHFAELEEQGHCIEATPRRRVIKKAA